MLCFVEPPLLRIFLAKNSRHKCRSVECLENMAPLNISVLLRMPSFLRETEKSLNRWCTKVLFCGEKIHGINALCFGFRHVDLINGLTCMKDRKIDRSVGSKFETVELCLSSSGEKVQVGMTPEVSQTSSSSSLLVLASQLFFVSFGRKESAEHPLLRPTGAGSSS